MTSTSSGSFDGSPDIDTPQKPFWLTIALFSCLPFLAILHPYAVFPIYFVISALTFRFVTWIPFLLVLKFVIFAILIFYYQTSGPTIFNISSIILADLFSMTLGVYLSRYPTEDILRSLANLFIVIIFIGFFVSIVMKSIGFDVADPLSFLDGKRFLILSESRAGHSISIELSTVVLAYLLSGYRRVKYHIAVCAVAIIILVISRSSTSLLCLVAIFSNYLIEIFFKNRLLANLIHILILLAIFSFLSDADFFNEFMRWFRVSIVGQDATAYRDGDFSAGRTMLNAIMFELAESSPYIGVGHEHPYLVMGVQALTGEAGAQSETPLRLAAKYGWPVFIVAVAAIFVPLLHGLRSFGGERRFFLALGYCILITSSGNGSFSIAQSPFYIIYAPLIWMAWSRSFSLRKVNSRGQGLANAH